MKEHMKQMKRKKTQLLPFIDKIVIEEKQKTSRPTAVKETVEEEEMFDKADMLEAHKLLVEKSNKRIMEKIEEIKQMKERETLVEQERLVREQQLALSLLKEIQKQPLRRRPEQRRKRPKLVEDNLTVLQRLLKRSQRLESVDRKQVEQWVDLEKNAAILHKTDKAIASKLRLVERFHEDDSSDYADYYDDLLELGDNIQEVIVPHPTQQKQSESSSNVRTEIRRFPGGQVSTKVSMGQPNISPASFSSPGEVSRFTSFSDLMG